jgi:large subunit ribosomal protein L35
MPKMKTNRAARKRFRLTATGKVRRNRANKSHILTKKDRKRKRHLRQSTIVNSASKKNVARLLPYGAD